MLSKLGTQLLRILMMDDVHSQTPGTFQIQRAVVDEKTFFGRALRNLESHAKDQFFRFARSNVAGAEEDQKISSKMKCLNAVLVELQRLIIDRADEILPRGSDLVEDRPSSRIFFRLGEHECGELLAGERARAIEQCSVQILIQGNEAGIECREREFMAVAKFLPVQVEGVCAFFSRHMFPPVRQDDASDVPNQRSDCRQGRRTSGLWTRAGLLRTTFLR